MPELEIIDIHTHTFVSAERGISWQRSLRDEAPPRNGTTEELLGIMERAEISNAVMLMYTPTRFMFQARIRNQELPSDPDRREQVERKIQELMAQRMIDNNEWAVGVSAKQPRLHTFLGIDPVYMDAETMVAEIEDKQRKGAKGVKIVPLALAIYGDDERLSPAYQKMSELGLPLVSQAGAGGETGDRGDAYGRPKYFASAMEDFPDLTVNVAHLGRGFEEDTIELCHRFPNFFADLSGRLAEIEDPNTGLSAQELADFVRQCGPEHIMFGTNFPMSDPEQYARVMRSLPLSDDEKEMVANGNAKKVLGL